MDNNGLNPNTKSIVCKVFFISIFTVKNYLLKDLLIVTVEYDIIPFHSAMMAALVALERGEGTNTPPVVTVPAFDGTTLQVTFVRLENSSLLFSFTPITFI